MSDVVIRVESLTKQYSLGPKRNSSGDGLRHALHDALTGPLRRIRSISRTGSAKSYQEKASANDCEDFFALRDVSFEVKRGEVLGIIGHNGAGKSTLLKILSRITEPTSGRIGLKGRVASLLEVGTGFHPELTGRENIYLNGAILGMTHQEVKSKFDEIVAFAEVDKFLDTAVKYYSSGMYVRLAFSVAAHLDPEILVVDEVLAVGDIQFQEKCLGKMQDVSTASGRTVLFVSHNQAAIKGLCPRSLLLRNGTLIADDSTTIILEQYAQAQWRPKANIVRKADVIIGDVQLSISSGNLQNVFTYHHDVIVTVVFEVVRPRAGAAIAIELVHRERGHILTTSTFDSKVPPKSVFIEPGSHSIRVSIPRCLLREGRYYLNVACTIPRHESIDLIEEVAEFLLVDSESAANRIGEGRRGAVMPQLDWHVQR